MPVAKIAKQSEGPSVHLVSGSLVRTSAAYPRSSQSSVTRRTTARATTKRPNPRTSLDFQA